MARINAIRAASTTHTAAGNKIASVANCYDGDLGTLWNIYYWERTDGTKDEWNTLTHHFPIPRDISCIAWKAEVHAQSWAGATHNHAGAGIYIEVSYNNGSTWTQVIGEQNDGVGNWSWDYSQNGNYVEDTNSGAGWLAVTDVRIRIWSKVERIDAGSGGGNEEAYGYIYELEAYYNSGGYAQII